MAALLFFLSLALCLSTGLSMESVKVEDGYEVFPSMPDSRYKLPPFNLNWIDASAACQSDGGGSHLVVMNSETEAAVVRELMIRVAGTSTPFAHVGITDIANEGQWVTVLGGLVTASGYNTWAPDRPSGGTGSNCGYVRPDALYYDDNCNDNQPFICEKPNV